MLIKYAYCIYFNPQNFCSVEHWHSIMGKKNASNKNKCPDIPSFIRYWPVDRGCKIRQLHFYRVLRIPKWGHLWSVIATCNTWKQDPDGWAVRDLAFKVITWQVRLLLGYMCCQKGSNLSFGWPCQQLLLNDCPKHIFQIGLMEN